jgi:tripartite-type tricarboxylate transporter receptor subunit TctC
MKTAILIGNALAMSGLTVCAGNVSAQDYPTKPIRLVVPNPPGGGNDFLGRLFGQKLSESLGQQVIIDNRPGAGSVIGAAVVARATPDGYTLLVSLPATHAVGPNLYRDVGYDAAKDFTPIAMLASSPMVLVANQTAPFKSVQELIALSKAKPGVLKYGSGGSGSASHMSAEVFKRIAGVDIVHIPYKGGGPAQIGVVSGEADILFDTTGSVLPLVQSGRVKALAITRATRLPEFPDIATFAEAGMPAYDITTWYAIHGPAGVPPEIVQKLNRELARILALADVKERLRLAGVDPVVSTPQQTGAFVQTEFARYAKLIKEAGIKPN